jgi:hypothetical protein
MSPNICVDGGISWKADRVYAAIDEDIDPVEQESTMPEANEYTEESFDKYLLAEVVLALGDGKQRAKVTGRKRDTDGNPVGVANSNQFWIPVFTQSSSRMGPKRSIPLTLLQSPCTLKLIKMDGSSN